jgi:poly-gamma-glutamate synthesis protein (capsule biosynthesis protein)
VTLAAVGDILLDRRVARRVARSGANYPFVHVTAILRQADIAFGNLECPVSRNARPLPKPYSFRASPETASGLAAAGFDVLSLANNHTLDCTRSGLTDTMAYLKRTGIAWCGAGMSGAEAASPLLLHRNGLKVGCVAFCDVIQPATYARSDLPSVAPATESGVRRAVQSARARADIVIASFHWGIEYAPRPTARQKALARAAAASGADLIVGHHPHVLQGLEWLPGMQGRRTLVAYSLGNFVFDAPRPAATQTVILEVTLGADGRHAARIRPCIIRNCRPVPASGKAAAAIIKRVAGLSAEMGVCVGADGIVGTGRTVRRPVP